MKKLLFLLIILAMGLSACRTTETSYELPNYPKEMSKEVFLEKVKKEGFQIETEKENYVVVAGFQIFGIPTESVRFSFGNDATIMTSVSMRIDKKHQNALLKKLKEQYGEPVDSYRQSEIHYFAKAKTDRTPNLLGPEEAIEGKSWVWHDQKPLAETWTKEEQEQFRSKILYYFGREGKKREGEDEDWNTYFENTWENTIILASVEDFEYMHLHWQTMYIPNKVFPRK